MNNFFVNVLLPLPFDKPFTYKTTSQKIEIGDLVKVSFRKKDFFGLVVEVNLPVPEISSDKIKEISQVNEQVKFSKKLIDFIDWIAAYNLAPKGLVLKAFIGILNSDKTKKPNFTAKKQIINSQKFSLKKLSVKQEKVADEILEEVNKKEHFVNLLDGVTGSGKTEIYFAAIAKILSANKEILRCTQDDKSENCHHASHHRHPERSEGSHEDNPQILILLPEIALTSQLVARFEEQFGFKPALWHSKISAKEKKEIFYGIISGSVKVLIGARSALLLPFKNLQLIVIDEEHDSSFKQEDIFNFHARDMAILKGKLESFPVILSSATPSLETYSNAISGKYRYFILDEKFNEQISEINIVDLRREKFNSGDFISQELRKEIAKNLEIKQQTLLFLNRRGYAPVTLCRACGQKVNCPNCSSYLVAHKSGFGKAKMVCHYCGVDEKLSTDCKFCKTKDSLVNIGVGVEKVKEEVEKLFPEARIALVTSDSVTNFKEADELVKRISDHEIDIIIGTQLIAKGYDFAGLTLVGVVDADSGFYSSELRSSEKSYQLLKQVIGRAGRRQEQGRVFIQTYNPQNFIFEKIIQQDKKSFYEFEMQNRQSLNMPPFTKMTAFIVSAFEEKLAVTFAKKIVSSFPFNDNIEILGPAPMPLLRLKNRYHYRVFLKAEKKVNLQKLITDVMKTLEIPSNIRVKIDIDPQ
jgi:primosomal protein N' (replication factor Y)